MKDLTLNDLVTEWLPESLDHIDLWGGQISCTSCNHDVSSLQLIGIISSQSVILLQKEFAGDRSVPIEIRADDPRFFDKLYKGLKREQDIITLGIYASMNL